MMTTTRAGDLLSYRASSVNLNKPTGMSDSDRRAEGYTLHQTSTPPVGVIGAGGFTISFAPVSIMSANPILASTQFL
jgi:hypothetical protein